MAASQEYIDGLVANPRESLTVEIKDWIDPRSDHGRAKIVRALIAMRNQNGGFLQIGFEDGTWEPNLKDVPADVRSVWDADELQGLATKYASTPFETHLRFSERGGKEFPVVEVEPGVRTPVAAKADLFDPADGSRKLVKQHAVYVRTLGANNTASTAEAKHGDWANLVERCFDNREADVGRFVRRHLSALDAEVLRGLAGVVGGLADPGPPPVFAAEEFRRDGHERFQRQKAERNLGYIRRHGAFEVAVVFEGEIPPRNLDEEFLNLINLSNPRYSGWPMWVDSRGFHTAQGTPDTDARPYTFGGGYEAFIRSEGASMRNHLDFWRAEPRGRFYLYRAFQDDMLDGPEHPEPLTTLDFGIVILRTAEAFAVPMAFARAMGAPPEGTTLHYSFRWSGLKDRELSSWADPARDIRAGYVARQHEEAAMLSLPLETPTSALGRHVRAATAPLFSAFNGFAPGPDVVENLTNEVLLRRS